MAQGRPTQPIVLSDETRKHLLSITRSLSLPHGLVRRAKIILMAAEGSSNKMIAEKLDLAPIVIGMWRRRFLRQGLMGLYDEKRPGGPRSISDERIARLIRKTLHKKPKGDTIGPVVLLHRKHTYQNQLYSGCGKHLPCNHTDKNISNCRPIPSLWKRFGILSVFISIPLRALWYCVSMRKVKFRRSTVPSPFYHWAGLCGRCDP